MTTRAEQATRWLVAVMCLAVVFRLACMVWLPLMDSTEARYGEIARKMFELGDWVTPWFDYGTPFWGKPPLSFWLTTTSFWILGVSEFAARLPHFLCMAGVAWIACSTARERPRDELLLAIALMAGAALFFVSAGAVMTDAELVVGTTLSMRGFWLALNGPRESAGRERLMLFAGLWIGLLAKGPLALVLVGLPIGAWAVSTRRLVETWRTFPWVRGLAATVLLAAPWYVAAELKTPGFLEYFLAGEHWHRFITPGWKGDRYGNAHQFPPGTIWLFAFAATLPWSVLLPVAALTWRTTTVSAPPRTREERTWLVYLACWTLAPLVFFTAARNIIWTYALPALPALALLCAAWLSRKVSHERASWLLAGGLVVLMLAVVAFGVHLYGSDTVNRKSAKALVSTWRASRTANEPLIFVGSRLQSASFYSDGAARLVSTSDQAAEQVAQRGGFVAMMREQCWANSRAHLLGRYGRYDLYHVDPSASEGPKTIGSHGAATTQLAICADDFGLHRGVNDER